MKAPRLAVALCHYPILNPDGEITTSAITNLDIHDMARSSTTYGVDRAYVVSPVLKQRELVEAVIHHWISGSGKQRCPGRSQAFQVLRPAGSIEEAVALEAQLMDDEPPLIVVTSARGGGDKGISFPEMSELLKTRSAIILFGTARGLADSVMDNADLRLPPINGPTAFNHLSVRAAIAITLDRLLGLDSGDQPT